MQPVDLTTLVAACFEVEQLCLPARLEQVHQPNSFTLYLQLRNASAKYWLLVSWHPQAARLHLNSQPDRQPDTFTFSQQIWHQVANMALVSVRMVRDWDRVVMLEFAKRPGDQIQSRLYIEIMGKRSNVVLVNGENLIVTAAHQVSDRQSRVRSIQTGDRYELPPERLDPSPSLIETFAAWRDRLSLIPQDIQSSLLKNYQGMSTSLVENLLEAATIAANQPTENLSQEQWQQLFRAWQQWLQALEDKQFSPHFYRSDRYTHGYSVIGLGDDQAQVQPTLSVNQLLQEYYGDRLNLQDFQQLYQQVGQAVEVQTARLQQKADGFEQKLAQSANSDQLKQRADLLMANSHNWQVGMSEIILLDFHTNEPVAIALDPSQTSIQAAQALYKKQQKLKRAKGAVMPLLAATAAEIHYLEQVITSATQLEPTEYKALAEIQQELIQQGYLKGIDKSALRTLKGKNQKSKKEEPPNCHRYTSPNGCEIWVGRNNYQNDLITFRVATEYDLWFHAQEIPGAHVLLRLKPGFAAERIDLQAAADISAFHSKSRQSDRVPIVYTQPRYVFKPKGAKPGMVIYKQEQVIWGEPAKLRQS